MKKNSLFAAFSIFNSRTMESKKMLRMRYNYDEVAHMLDVSAKTLRNEIRRNADLSAQLSRMGLGATHKKPLKKHVIEMFRYFGFPDGYEHYEVNYESSYDYQSFIT
jgi:hypothetical protein